MASCLCHRVNIVDIDIFFQTEAKNVIWKQALNDSTYLTSNKSMVAPEASRGVTMFFQNRKIKRNTAQIIQTKCCYAEKYKTEAPQWKALSTWSMCICSKYFFGICVLQSVFFQYLIFFWNLCSSMCIYSKYFFGICVLQSVFFNALYL